MKGEWIHPPTIRNTSFENQHKHPIMSKMRRVITAAALVVVTSLGAVPSHAGLFKLDFGLEQNIAQEVTLTIMSATAATSGPPKHLTVRPGTFILGSPLAYWARGLHRRQPSCQRLQARQWRNGFNDWVTA